MKISESLTGICQPIAFYSDLAFICGSSNAAIFLCQLAYWTGKQKDKDGWIFKTQLEWEIETSLSEKEQAAARSKLRVVGLIEEKYAGLPRKLFYRLNTEELDQQWESWLPVMRIKAALSNFIKERFTLSNHGFNTGQIDTTIKTYEQAWVEAKKNPKEAETIEKLILSQTSIIAPPNGRYKKPPTGDTRSDQREMQSIYPENTFIDYKQKENTPYIPQVQHPDFGCGEEEGKDGQNANLQEADLQQPSSQTQEGGKTPNTQEAELQRVIATNSSFPDQNSGSSTQTDILIRVGSSAAQPQNPTATESSNPPQSQETGNLSKSTQPTPQAAKKPRKMDEAEVADLVAHLNLIGEPLTGQHFAYRLLPWEINAGPNGLDSEFCQWLAKALSNTSSAYQGGCSLGQAKQWLKQARFQLPRLDAVYCRWVEYQESLTKKQQQIEQVQTEEKHKPQYLTQEEITRRCQQIRAEMKKKNILSLKPISSPIAS